MLGISNEQDRVLTLNNLQYGSQKHYNKWSEKGSDIQYLEPGLSNALVLFAK